MICWVEGDGGFVVVPACVVGSVVLDVERRVDVDTAFVGVC